MSTIIEQSQPLRSSSSHMECRYCHKIFSKGEHLRRHERSHTGSRPYVCKECKRPFARQDSLARHEKLHIRRDHSQYPSPPSSHISQPSIASPVSTTEIADSFEQAASHIREREQFSAAEQCAPTSATLSQNVPLSAELDFDLVWPDSEYLFENLMSSSEANANQWQMPLGSLPISARAGSTFGNASSFHDRGTSIGAIPSGESHQAVHNVSEMVTALSSNVTTAVEATSLSSVFLDECLHMFFVRFVPTFPVMHRATFVFRECTQPLLLNAMAIGSLYLGPKDSVPKGEALWRLAHLAVATSWETLVLHRGPYDPCAGVQLVVTALLAQVYGALSKNRAIRTTSQAFHALGFYWARQCALADSEPYSMSDLPSLDVSEGEKDRSWRIWAAKEIQQRALLGHYLLDGLIARMTGETPSVRHAANQLSLPSTEAAFEARTANEWLTHLRSQDTVQCSFRTIIRSLFSPVDQNQMLRYNLSAFSLRVILEGLQSLVSDCDSEDVPMMGVPAKSELRGALAQIHESITISPSLSTSERLETLLRWHTICLDACRDSSLLCRSVCTRYGIHQSVCAGPDPPKPEADLMSWVYTPNGRQALLHAIAIQEIVEALPRGRAHVIHIPSSLFSCSTIYCVFSLGGLTTVNVPDVVHWQTALSSKYEGREIPGQPDSIAQAETKRYMRGEYGMGAMGATKNLLYELNSMQKLFRCLCSQWGVAFDMEDVLDQWIALCH